MQYNGSCYFITYLFVYNSKQFILNLIGFHSAQILILSSNVTIKLIPFQSFFQNIFKLINHLISFLVLPNDNCLNLIFLNYRDYLVYIGLISQKLFKQIFTQIRSSSSVIANPLNLVPTSIAKILLIQRSLFSILNLNKQLDIFINRLMKQKLGNSQIKNVSGQSSIGSSNNYAVQPRKQNQIKNDNLQDPLQIQQSSKANNVDLQIQMLELKTKYSQLELNYMKMEQFLQQQSDSISQLLKGKSEVDNNSLNNQQIQEIKKIVLNILEQNKMPQQQKLLQDLDKINVTINNHQSQILDQKMQIEQLKQGSEGHKNLKDHNEHILKQFQQLKDQINSQVQLQMIKIQDDLKQNLSQQNQQQQIIVQIEKELINLKTRIEQMSQQNQQNSLNIKEQLTKQNRMSLVTTQQCAKEIGSSQVLGGSSKDMGNSIIQMGVSNGGLAKSGVQQDGTSKLIQQAYQEVRQSQIKESTQVSKQQFSNQIYNNSNIKEQAERERNLTNISNCSSLRDATYTCFLCNIQTNENYRQTRCGHVYHNTCYRKWQEQQIQQQRGRLKCMCNQILAQNELFPDLKPNYYTMQLQFIYKKSPDQFQKCRNYEKCSQFWLKDKYLYSDLCIECNQNKNQNQQQPDSLKIQPTLNNKSQFSQQPQPLQITMQKANPQPQQQQKSNFTIDQKIIQNQRQPLLKQGTPITLNSKIKLLGITEGGM